MADAVRRRHRTATTLVGGVRRSKGHRSQAGVPLARPNAATDRQSGSTSSMRIRLLMRPLDS